MNKINAVIVLLLLQAIMISAQKLKFQFHTVRIPSSGAWLKCAESPSMISYAIQLASKTDSLDPTYYGGDYYKLKDYKATEVGYGFYAEVTDLTYGITGFVCGEMGPGASVACTREGPIYKKGIWCLAIANPFLNDINVDVVVSFTQSVFVAGTYRKDPNEDDTAIGKSGLSYNKTPNKKRNLGRSKTLRLDGSY
ncbi:1182_t:CDS:2 [Funneliformis geosporum]|uniref:14304_t:CDS:1 n=1 Tax=Funneliformis geosporum TaxID=1117311 RepID=A0A9W4SP57_9GLOM|nr:1182_t:CDS:2 [Funneliformis geosporum]CAI2176314.1 14304_t:CDS:2 [Funneliformis geosporum]